ncbi:MAG TPA: hypothetical protein DDW30_02820 [Clostridiales bacterium]|nr:hypothetical protein [Clostridiales bacterium]
MTNRISTKRALILSLLSMLLCASMLIGSTYAWFTDTATTSVNTIQAGTLKVDIVNESGASVLGTGLSFRNVDGTATGEAILWEPGCTYRTEGFKIKSTGNLALKYKIYLNGIDGNSELLNVITFSIVNASGNAVDLNAFEGHLAANATATETLYLQGTMAKEAGNDYQGKELTGISITVVATQDTVEKDSNGNTYDENAQYPVFAGSSEELIDALKKGGEITVNKNVTLDGTVDENGVVNPDAEAQLKDAGTVDLVLNGTITSGNLAGYTFGCMRVMPGTQLVISAGENGQFINTKSYSAINVCGGEVVVNGGYFESAGVCFFVYNDADKNNKLTINGGTFKSARGVIDNTDMPNNSTVIINGGTFIDWDPSDYVDLTVHTVTENNGVWTVQ